MTAIAPHAIGPTGKEPFKEWHLGHATIERVGKPELQSSSKHHLLGEAMIDFAFPLQLVEIEISPQHASDLFSSERSDPSAGGVERVVCPIPQKTERQTREHSFPYKLAWRRHHGRREKQGEG